jgi:hypothetical protein
VDTPTYDSDGLQVWNPQPGEYHKYGLTQRESYGGIIAAINDVRISKTTGQAKSYPHNFAGIIAAIADLGEQINIDNNIDIGETPPGWNIIINPDNGTIDGNWQDPPTDGNLWFDQRQGRLFVAVDGEYYQTNGGDGLAAVDDQVPTSPAVVGSTWFDTTNRLLYVRTDDDIWSAVKGADTRGQSTADLPLVNKNRLINGQGEGWVLPADFPASSEWPSILPEFDIDKQNVQAQFNEWGLWADVELGKGIEAKADVYVQDTAPSDGLKSGDLWFNTVLLQLNVWSDNQWVAATTVDQYSEQITALNTFLNTERDTRISTLSGLRTELLNLINTNSTQDAVLLNRLNALEADVNTIERIDSTGLVRTADVDKARSDFNILIAEVRSEIPTINHLQTKAETDASIAELQTAIAPLATAASVQQVSNSIPSIQGLEKTVDVDAKLADVSANFFPRSGGRVTGGIQMEKQDIAVAGFDFSSQPSAGRKALSFKSNANTENYVTFGTTGSFWEYAWQFTGEEDFAWVYNDTSKVFSISKDGAACSQLILGDFQENTAEGRSLVNKINVRDRLTKYQTAFTQMKSSVQNATDFDSLKSAILQSLSEIQ